jgi:hypothetical protein
MNYTEEEQVVLRELNKTLKKCFEKKTLEECDLETWFNICEENNNLSE